MQDEPFEPMSGTGLRERLADFQHRLIDRTWGITVLLAVIGLINNVIAAIQTGRPGAFAVNIVACLAMIVGYFFIHRIVFTVKVVIMIVLMIALGFANFLDGGMFGAGWYWFVSAAFLIAVFYTIRAGLIGLSLFGLLVVIVGIGYVNGSMMASFDLSQRNRDIATWVNFFTVVTLVSLVILNMIGGYLKAIQELLVEVNAQRNQAEAASRAKSEFLSNMSQELRTPLKAVLGVAGQIEDDAGTAAHTRQQAHEIGHSGKLLLGLIDDLLDLSRIESGKLELHIQPMTVGSLTEKSFALVSEAASKAGVSLINEGGSGEGATVRADPIRLLQVVMNFLSNAVHYNVPGGEARLSYTLANGRVRIAVQDTGRGIPEDKLLRVFRAFDRLGFENSKIEGRGIGLIMSKRIVEALGGTIGFNSMEGKGSTFWAEFPVATG